MAATSSRPAARRHTRALLLALVVVALVACLLPTAGGVGTKVASAQGARPSRTKSGQLRNVECVTNVDEGCVKISTTPGGHPIMIDSRPAGTTTESARQIALPKGTHTVEIVFPDGNNWRQTFDVQPLRVHCINLAYNPRRVEIPPAPVIPCPYPVTVNAPSMARDGDIVTFSAAADYLGQSGLNYTWTVSPPSARIMSGAGTQTITVDTTSLGSRRVTAIVVVDDGSGNRNCRQTAQAATAIEPIGPPPGDVGDDFISVSNDADKARLDYLAIKMQENPTYHAYVIAYGGRTSCRQQADLLIQCALRYLVGQRGVDASRVTTINGGLREKESYEFWVLSPGKPAPVAKPTLSPAEARPRRTCSRRCS